jgi:hypothetical protein
VTVGAASSAPSFRDPGQAAGVFCLHASAPRNPGLTRPLRAARTLRIPSAFAPRALASLPRPIRRRLRRDSAPAACSDEARAGFAGGGPSQRQARMRLCALFRKLKSSQWLSLGAESRDNSRDNDNWPAVGKGSQSKSPHQLWPQVAPPSYRLPLNSMKAPRRPALRSWARASAYA